MSSTPVQPLKVLIIGGSRNIGYLTGLHLLDEGHTVTYLLRNPRAFDNDQKMQTNLRSGRARVVQGDSLIEDDIRRAWTEVCRSDGTEGQVDFVLSTVGTTPKFALTRGVAMDIPDICTRSVRNLLSSMPAHLRRPGQQPRIIVVSGTGIGNAGLAALPFFPNLVSRMILGEPRRDKLGMELVLAHVTGKKDAWVSSSERVPKFILPEGWETSPGLPKIGEMPRIVLVRPAWLTDGEETGVYRRVEGYGDQQYIARRDVAHFIGKEVMERWMEYEGKAVTIGY